MAPALDYYGEARLSGTLSKVETPGVSRHVLVGQDRLFRRTREIIRRSNALSCTDVPKTAVEIEEWSCCDLFGSELDTTARLWLS